MPARICHYIRTDGRRCGSPALRGRDFCYFHYQVNRPRPTVPPLENGDAIQLALTDLARAVLAETIDLKRAGVLAYILQTATVNLKQVQLGAFPSDMVPCLPKLPPSTADLDAAYSTLTRRALPETLARTAAAPAPAEPRSPAEDVLLTRHSLA